MSCEFEVYQDGKREYRWRFRASNGEVTADSAESYKTKAKCLHGIKILQEEAPTAQIDDHTTKKLDPVKKAKT
jgi:uncharacterized protein YegP (UPF0339 family)